MLCSPNGTMLFHMADYKRHDQTREAIIRHRHQYSKLWLLREQYADCCKENMDQGRRHQRRCTIVATNPSVFPNFRMWSCFRHGHKRLSHCLVELNTPQL